MPYNIKIRDEKMKKKLVIVTRKMVMGGIEKALLSMLNSIPNEMYDITVLVMEMGGELQGEIAKHVKFKCLFGNERTTIEKIGKSVKKGRLVKAIKTGWYTLLSKKAKNNFNREWYFGKTISGLNEVYDIAIAYHTPASFPVVYVMTHINAKRKIAWIHSDVSVYQQALKSYEEFYDKYDKIFCVSAFARKKLIELYPRYSQKTSVFYNILDVKQMRRLANNNEGFKDSFTGTRILTVGRLTSEKGQDLIPNVLKRLTTQDYPIRWYCIGDGECRGELEQLISMNNLNDDLILLGTQINPYPFISECDIYVQPSRHEGYCISLAEARAFNKPIITTDTVGAREQIIHGENGTIINFDEEELYEAIKKLIQRKYENLINTNSEEVNEEHPQELEKLLECIT